MAKALKEYNEMVLVPSWGWLKKHWKGYTVLLVITTIVPFILFYWSDIVDGIKEKFNGNKEEP